MKKIESNSEKSENNVNIVKSQFSNENAIYTPYGVTNDDILKTEAPMETKINPVTPLVDKIQLVPYKKETSIVNEEAKAKYDKEVYSDAFLKEAFDDSNNHKDFNTFKIKSMDFITKSMAQNPEITKEAIKNKLKCM